MDWKRFWRRKQRDDDFAVEVEAHLAHEIDDNLQAGMSPDEARFAALRKFGNVTAVKEVVHEMNTVRVLESFWQDLRHGVRLLRLNPAVAVVATMSLALGMGANAAVFQLLDAVRLRSLPVRNPEELVEIQVESSTGRSGRFSGRRPQLSHAIWEQIRDRQQAFSGLLAWGSERFDLTGGGEARYAEGFWVSDDLFRVIGVPALLGRVFAPGDDARDCAAPGAVISYAFWQREFGGEPSAVGRPLSLDGHRFEVIGVTPANFFGVEVGRRFEVAVPLCAQALLHPEDNFLVSRHTWWLAVIGRLKQSWSIERATADLEAISAGIFEGTLPTVYQPEDAKAYLAFKLRALPARSGVSSLRSEYSTPLWLLMATSGLVLLIACANIANLMLARANAREREISVRLAIGASRGRLIRQLLAESLLLAAIGAALGVVLARNLSRFLLSFLSTERDPLFLHLQTDWRVLLFMAGLTVSTCLLFGLTPALRGTRVAAGTAIRAAGRG